MTMSKRSRRRIRHVRHILHEWANFTRETTRLLLWGSAATYGLQTLLELIANLGS